MLGVGGVLARAVREFSDGAGFLSRNLVPKGAVLSAASPCDLEHYFSSTIDSFRCVLVGLAGAADVLMLFIHSYCCGPAVCRFSCVSTVHALTACMPVPD